MITDRPPPAMVIVKPRIRCIVVRPVLAPSVKGMFIAPRFGQKDPLASRGDDESDFETRVIRDLVAQTQEALRRYYRAGRRKRATAPRQKIEIKNKKNKPNNTTTPQPPTKKTKTTPRKKAPPYTRWRFSDLELLLAADQTLTAHGPLHGDEGHHRDTRGEQDVDQRRHRDVLELRIHRTRYPGIALNPSTQHDAATHHGHHHRIVAVGCDRQRAERNDELECEEGPPQRPEIVVHHAPVTQHVTGQTAVPHDEVLREIELGPQDRHAQHELSHLVEDVRLNRLHQSSRAIQEEQQHGQEAEEHVEVALEVIEAVAGAVPTGVLRLLV